MPPNVSTQRSRGAPPRREASKSGGLPDRDKPTIRPFTRMERRVTWLLLFALVFILDLSIRKRAYSDKSLDPQVIIKIITWAACSLWALWHHRRFQNTLFNWSTAPWLLLIVLFAISAAWSEWPSLTLSSAASLMIVFVFTIFSLATLGEEETATCAAWSCTLFLAICVVLYFAMPEFARSTSWSGTRQVMNNRMDGITAQPNIAGHMAGMLILMAVVYFKPLANGRKWVPFIPMAIGAAALVLTQSRTTALGLAFALMSFYLFRRSTRWTLPLMAIGAALVLMYAIPNTEDLAKSVSRSGQAEEIFTATSRTHIWKLGWWMFQQKPLQGYGYGAITEVMTRYAPSVTPELGSYKPPHAHNAYLQVLLSAGLPALILFVIGTITNIRGLIVRRASAAGMLLIFWLIISMTEAVGFIGVALLTTFNMFFPIGVACLASSAKRRPAKVRTRATSIPGQPIGASQTGRR